jgi:anti-sigma regulatory factor (Ser/Thr protein kinase)/predicted transcriptional regulator
VMKSPVITVSPGMRMSDLRSVLRDNRISGVPVTEGSSLVGIVSVEDFITWLSQGAPECSVADRMSRSVVTAYSDDSLVHAVELLESRGYGRLPVLRRDSGELAGIVTKGAVIEGLMHELEIGYRSEEIQQYRASHLFEDIVADAIALTFSYHIGRGDILRGGEVSSKLRRSLKRLGIVPESVRRAAIAAYEAEMNVMIYAGEGDLAVVVDPAGITIEISDKGPGIPDVEKAMEPGYSSAPDWVRRLGFGAGMGLPNIKRCADEFELTSTVGEGTSLRIMVSAGAA